MKMNILRKLLRREKKRDIYKEEDLISSKESFDVEIKEVKIKKIDIKH